MPDLMDGPGRWDSIQLLDRARAGDADCLGGLLEIYRSYFALPAGQSRLIGRTAPQPGQSLGSGASRRFYAASRHFGEFLRQQRNRSGSAGCAPSCAAACSKCCTGRSVRASGVFFGKSRYKNSRARSGPEAAGSGKPDGQFRQFARKRMTRGVRSYLSRVGRVPVQAAGAFAAKSWCCGIWKGLSFSEVADRMGRSCLEPSKSSLVTGARASAATANDRGVAMKPDKRPGKPARGPAGRAGEPQVLCILEEYLAELECGGRPSPEDSDRSSIRTRKTS